MPGWGAPVISAAATPFAVAQRLGWFEASGNKLRILPTQGSVDLVKQIATVDPPFGFPSIEPMMIVRPLGVKARMCYTAFQRNSYGLAVPADGPIHDFIDLKGKTIGVTRMGSASVVIARALVAGAGLDSGKNVRIVAVGEAGRAAAMLRGKQADALSQFDAGYAMIDNAGVKLRYMNNSGIAHFPSNGLFSLEKTLVDHRMEAVARAQGLTRGSIFMTSNPRAAVRMLFEAFPQLKPTGIDDEAAIPGALPQAEAVMHVFPLEQSGVTKWGVVKQKVPATDLVTNDLIDDINKIDPDAIVAQAKAYKP